MHRTGRAVELLVVVAVLHVLVLLSLQGAGTRVEAVLERAERQQATLSALALEREQAVGALAGEPVLVAQAPAALPETPAVRLGRSFVAATSWELPADALGALATATVTALALRTAVRRSTRRRRREAVRRPAVALTAFSPRAARCGSLDPRGTLLLPAR